MLQLHTIYYKALEKTPNKTAFTINDVSVTYTELHSNVLHYSNALTKLGIQRGSCIGIVADDSPQAIFLGFACFLIGAIVVPIHWTIDTENTMNTLQQCNVRHIFLGRPNAKTVKDSIHANIHNAEAYILDPEENWLNASNASASSPVSETISPSHPAVIININGQNITHTHFSLYNAARQHCETIRLNDSSVVLTSAPFCKNNRTAPAICLFPALYCGATIRFMTQFDAQRFATELLIGHITHTHASPEQWKSILNELPKNKALSSLVYSSTFTTERIASLQRKHQRVTGCPLSLQLCLSECGACLTTAPGEVNKTDSFGRPVLGYEIQLLDSNNTPVEQGETGHLTIRSKAMMIGYWNDPVATENALLDGWYHSDILAHKDINGYYYLTATENPSADH